MDEILKWLENNSPTKEAFDSELEKNPPSKELYRALIVHSLKLDLKNKSSLVVTKNLCEKYAEDISNDDLSNLIFSLYANTCIHLLQGDFEQAEANLVAITKQNIKNEDKIPAARQLSSLYYTGPKRNIPKSIAYLALAHRLGDYIRVLKEVVEARKYSELTWLVLECATSFRELAIQLDKNSKNKDLLNIIKTIFESIKLGLISVSTLNYIFVHGVEPSDFPQLKNYILNIKFYCCYKEKEYRKAIEAFEGIDANFDDFSDFSILEDINPITFSENNKDTAADVISLKSKIQYFLIKQLYTKNKYKEAVKLLMYLNLNFIDYDETAIKCLADLAATGVLENINESIECIKIIIKKLSTVETLLQNELSKIPNLLKKFESMEEMKDIINILQNQTLSLLEKKLNQLKNNTTVKKIHEMYSEYSNPLFKLKLVITTIYKKLSALRTDDKFLSSLWGNKDLNQRLKELEICETSYSASNATLSENSSGKKLEMETELKDLEIAGSKVIRLLEQIKKMIEPGSTNNNNNVHVKAIDQAVADIKTIQVEITSSAQNNNNNNDNKMQQSLGTPFTTSHAN